MKKFTTKMMCRSGLIASLYIALTLSFAWLSFSGVQYRISESLTILPLFFPESVIGLTIGCFVSNLFSSNGPIDAVYGTIGTLVASLATFGIGIIIKHKVLKFIIGALPPVLFNAIIVPFTFLAITELESLYWINFFSVGFGQFVVIYTLGAVVYFATYSLKKRKVKYFK